MTTTVRGTLREYAYNNTTPMDSDEIARDVDAVARSKWRRAYFRNEIVWLPCGISVKPLSLGPHD